MAGRRRRPGTQRSRVGRRPRRRASAPRVSLAWPRTANEAELDRAAGCLLGQVIGDSLGALVAHFGEVEHSDRFGVNTRIGVG